MLPQAKLLFPLALLTHASQASYSNIIFFISGVRTINFVAEPSVTASSELTGTSQGRTLFRRERASEGGGAIIILRVGDSMHPSCPRQTHTTPSATGCGALDWQLTLCSRHGDRTLGLPCSLALLFLGLTSFSRLFVLGGGAVGSIQKKRVRKGARKGGRLHVSGVAGGDQVASWG